jgi:precorrin-6B methylase 1
VLDRPPAPAGSLTVVGTGIQVGVHLTPEARDAIERAERVLYLAEPTIGISVRALNPRAQTLDSFYQPDRPRRETYAAMVEAILAPVREGEEVCAAFYGHPGMLVRPGHEAIRRARAEGFEARMLPGVSAEDCLVADLGVDPGQLGWQSYEATEFLVHRRTPDISAGLVLWQIGVVGCTRYSPAPDRAHVSVLIEYLCRFYPPEHDAVLYEASPYPVTGHVAQRLALAQVTPDAVTPMATMYVPPAADPQPDPEMLGRLGLGQAWSSG